MYEEYKKIAAREGRSIGELTRELIEGYVKVHAGGNPTFELDQWIQKPDFVGDPAVRESNEKWDKYLVQCEEKELAQLQGVFQWRVKQAKDAWLKKKTRCGWTNQKSNVTS